MERSSAGFFTIVCASVLALGCGGAATAGLANAPELGGVKAVPTPPPADEPIANGDGSCRPDGVSPLRDKRPPCPQLAKPERDSLEALIPRVKLPAPSELVVPGERCGRWSPVVSSEVVASYDPATPVTTTCATSVP